MEQEIQHQSFFQRIWVRYGLIGGGAAILTTVVLYVIDEKMLFNGITAMVPIFVLLAVAIFAAAEKKREQGGLLNFGQGVGTSFGTFVLGEVLSTLFNIILYKVIDPSLLEKSNEFQISRMQEALDKGDLSQEQFDAIVQRFDNPNMFLFSALMGVVMFAVGALVIFLITSAILRKEEAQ